MKHPLVPTLLLSLASVQAQEQSLDTLTSITGGSVQGTVVAIDAKGEVALRGADGKTTTHALGTLRDISFGKSSPTALPRHGAVWLRSGVEIPANIESVEGRRVTIRSTLLQDPATFSLNHVHAIRFAKLPLDDDGGFTKYLADPKEDADLIYFKTTDSVVQRSVTVEGFDEGKLVYQTRGDSRNRALSGLYGVVMGRASGFPPDPLPRPRVALRVQGGTELRGRLESLDATLCKLTTAEQVGLTVHRDRITGLVVESDRMIYLTDLKPIKVDQTAAFRDPKPWHANRSPLGEGIQIGGSNPRAAQNGLVLIPRTRLTYDIGAGFDFFEATICIEARSTGPAHAVFRIKAGETLLFESDPITRQTEPLAIKVPLKQATQLTIEADFGKNFDFGDHCVFAEARVLKQGT